MCSTEYFECKCSTPEHTLRFWFEEEDSEFYISTFLDELPFRNRLWLGLKYILGYKCRYGHFAEFILNPEDAGRLSSLLSQANLQKEKREPK